MVSPKAAREEMRRERHNRKKDIDPEDKFSAGWVGFTAIFMSIFAIVLFSKTNNVAILFFAGFVILVALVLPPLIDFLKSSALKAIEREKKEPVEWKKSMERIENLEALICRLDAELNSQLEQAVSAGRVTTLTGIGASQVPTVFLNVSAALEKRFQVLKELGRGGMGIVYQAYDKQLKEQVAIKILSPLLSTNADALERLKREVAAARRITHPNVIRMHDISESEGLHFVSMEYFSGTTLKDLVKRNGPFSENKGAHIAFQICDGLESAHRQGVIHRDLKSQNVIVNDTGDLKIIDFGLASSTHHEGMTATGLILGTPEYMAPEQVVGKKADERADLYSLGIILYEIFTGKVPFSGESAIAIGFQQMREEPAAPSSVNSKISEQLEKVILKALEKNPNDRHSSVAELRADLQAAFGFAPIPTLEQPGLKTETQRTPSRNQA